MFDRWDEVTAQLIDMVEPSEQASLETILGTQRYYLEQTQSANLDALLELAYLLDEFDKTIAKEEPIIPVSVVINSSYYLKTGSDKISYNALIPPLSDVHR
jgi:hypothetical protein